MKNGKIGDRIEWTHDEWRRDIEHHLQTTSVAVRVLGGRCDLAESCNATFPHGVRGPIFSQSLRLFIPHLACHIYKDIVTCSKKHKRFF